MKLSVIIVNYNVKHFLEQCLHSVRKASKEISMETFVVDNCSVDGSIKTVEEKFPEVKIIANSENVGFSRANNQAIAKASGEYILLLNPDTVVEQNTLKDAVEFMDTHPDAGGLGVKMVDGKGNFLPESKRGLPTPEVAFYKIFGLSRLFPHSRRFSKYHLGYLDKNETHEVDILAGAFMLLRKKVLDKVGLLDETFFMYGEDIDLSYRILKAGYKNYYYPKARIIHYKGESTKKGSLNYVFVFYQAMIIFARKHFSKQKASIFSFFINMAVYFRAFLAVFSRFWKKGLLPLLDALLLTGGIIVIKNLWESNVIFEGGGGHFPTHLVYIMLPAYIFIWLFSVFLSGGYDKPVYRYKILRGYLFGTILILAGYGLLSEDYRFSRAIIVFGALWGCLASIGVRYIARFLKIGNFQMGDKLSRRFLVVANEKEGERISELIRRTHTQPGFIGLVSPGNPVPEEQGYLGSLSQIREIINIYGINEIVFSADDIPAQNIIDQMSSLQGMQVDYKIAPPESYSIIGSNSISTSGDLYIIDINSISKPNNKRNKRLLDIVMSVALLLTAPVSIFVAKRPLGCLINMFSVLIGNKTFVGYSGREVPNSFNLPPLKNGILSPADSVKLSKLNHETLERLNLLYARNYNIYNDLNIIYRGFRELGR